MPNPSFQKWSKVWFKEHLEASNSWCTVMWKIEISIVVCVQTTWPLSLEACDMGPFGLNLLLLKLKTENWKQCSKIIFKCVNSTVWLIFNIFFMNKVTVGLINSTATVLFVPSFLQNAWNEKKKKKKKKRRRQTQVSAESKRHHSWFYQD